MRLEQIATEARLKPSAVARDLLAAALALLDRDGPDALRELLGRAAPRDPVPQTGEPTQCPVPMK